MIKTLNFIEFWDSKNADEEATKFLIQTIYRLIENEMPEDKNEEGEPTDKEEIEYQYK